MQNQKLKIWSCIALLVVLTVAGFQGDNRLDSWTTVEAAAQPPQECKDAAGMTIPCPPDTGNQGDQGRTDCQDTDRDGVCDADEPRECVGQPNELGNGCPADDDLPGTPRAKVDYFLWTKTGFHAATYPQPNCNDPDVSNRAAYLKLGTIKGESNTTSCPDPEPVFDCELTSPFSFCNTFASEDDGATESCIPYPDGSQHCCAPGACVCTGFDACNDLIASCIGLGHKYEGDSDGGSCTRK